MGWPRVIQSDNGGAFVNQVMDKLQQLFGVEQVLGAAYNHQAQGKVEWMI